MVNNDLKFLNGSKGLHNNKPDYYCFVDGTKTTSKRCKLLLHNMGLIFVSK